jgi:hypothetical protein
MMKQTVMKTCLSLLAVLALAIGVSARPANATNVGTLAVGTSYSDTIKSNGPSFNQDYNFHLDGTVTGLTILATALSQNSGSYGVDTMKIALFDSASHLIASATGTPLIGFDSFAQSGLALGAGDYLFNVMGNVTAGKKAFVSISLAANNVATTPIPGAGLMLLTGFGALGGLAYRRRRASGSEPPSLAA